MALITVAQLAVELRITTDASTPPPEPYFSILTRALESATAWAEHFAPAASDVAKSEAIARLVAYRFDSPGSWAGVAFGNPEMNSGAMRALALYRPVITAVV